MSADFTWIQPQTAAKTSTIFDARASDINVSADNLAGTETVNILVVAGNTNVQLADSTGAAIKLTATIPSMFLKGGAYYVFDKSVTAGACGVYVNVKSN